MGSNFSTEFIMNYDTVLSKDRKYRYQLFREVTPDPGECPFANNDYLMFIGLNPSTADEKYDDATIRICKKYAARWGFRRLCMANLFAYRETNPEACFRVKDPIGPSNNFTLMDLAAGAGLIVAVWGRWGCAMERDLIVLNFLADYPIYVLKFNADWSPHHPLRMQTVAAPTRWMEADRIGNMKRDDIEDLARLSPPPVPAPEKERNPYVNSIPC